LGKRFHIKLVSKKLVDTNRETSEQKRFVTTGVPVVVGYRGRGMVAPRMLEENVPITIDVEDFQYSYKCKHCGHEWTEAHVESHKEV
jgi:hypothetical protein